MSSIENEIKLKALNVLNLLVKDTIIYHLLRNSQISTYVGTISKKKQD